MPTRRLPDVEIEIISIPGGTLATCNVTKNKIQLNADVKFGTHRDVRPGSEFSYGRYRYMIDSLLHEMCHLAAGVVGHGDEFLREANRVGAMIGVEPHHIDGTPNVKHWPCRPRSFFGGALTDTAIFI